MADPASRPRAPLRRRPGARTGATSGDLFEHFGVAREPGEPTLAAVVTAAACPGCGWLCSELAADEDRGCPVCARPRPPTPANSTEPG